MNGLYKLTEDIINRILDEVSSNNSVLDKNYVICAECNKKMLQIQYRHLKYKHNMTIEEYKNKYPNSKLVCESAKCFGTDNVMSRPEVKNIESKNMNNSILLKELIYQIENSSDPIGTKILLQCGGAAGHMAHPFDFVKNGKQLIAVFKKSIDSLKKGSGSVKIDGLNASIRLVNGKFVMDRGSAKPIDVNGMRPEDLEGRFGVGHGMIGVGTKVLNIFDSAYSSIESELKSLGLVQNSNIMLNIEFVEGQSNIQTYDIKNFLAIHGLLEIKPVTFNKNGEVKSRKAFEISYSQSTMNKMIEKLNPFAEKFGFKIVGSVSPVFKNDPNLISVLTEKVTINRQSGAETKTLLEWLKSTNIPHPMVTKDIYLKVSQSKNVDKDLQDMNIDEAISGYITWLATIKLGDEILKNLTSEIGDLDKHEGVVIRDSSIYNKPFKITGSFIINVLSSKFNKK